MKLTRQEIYSEITHQLKEKLSSGNIPWRKSWEVGLPTNLQSKRRYNGINFLTLSMNDFPSPYYLTFLQCKERGGSINRGEKGSWVIYWDIKEITKETDSESPRRIPFIKKSTIFNLAQTSLYNTEDEECIIIACEDIIASLDSPPIIKNNTMRAYYSPVEDYISLPPCSAFDSETEYYSTLMHELVHWTGHSSRLNRSQLNQVSEKHSYEELIAEIGSAYLCGMCRIAPKTLGNQAAYIQGWLSLVEKDDNIFMKAAADAQKAVNYLLNPQPILV